jgi:hypothetical protein
MPLGNLRAIADQFSALKIQARRDLRHDSVIDRIATIYHLCDEYLASTVRISLISKVENKTFFAFQDGPRHSRAVNENLFTGSQLVTLFVEAVKNNAYLHLTAEQITQACYLLVMAFCGAIDLLKTGDQKTPGTFYEILVGHLYARTFGVNPGSRIQLKLDDAESVAIQTDYIFDLGPHRPRYHIPIKTSTRERASEVWLHQTMLDRAFGAGSYIGLLTCLAETKLDHRTFEVVEIYVPNQWRAYQRYAARIARAYYLDPPRIYLELSEKSSGLIVKPFGEFFFEDFLAD